MKILAEGGAMDIVIKVWFALQLQQGFIILGVKLFKQSKMLDANFPAFDVL